MKGLPILLVYWLHPYSAEIRYLPKAPHNLFEVRLGLRAFFPKRGLSYNLANVQENFLREGGPTTRPFPTGLGGALQWRLLVAVAACHGSVAVISVRRLEIRVQTENSTGSTASTFLFHRQKISFGLWLGMKIKMERYLILGCDASQRYMIELLGFPSPLEKKMDAVSCINHAE